MEAVTEVKPRVNKENIKKWVDALRSGKYTQETGRLKNPDTGAMCCLGVACDISGVGQWKANSGWGDNYITDTSESTQVLPDEVAEWLFGTGAWRNPSLRDAKGHHTRCSYVNDDHGWNFAQIADAVEREYLRD